MIDLPTLVERCLTFGVVIMPYQQKSVLIKYEQYKIPDDQLNNLKKTDLETYVNALYLSSQEMAGDWARGHALLIELGFERKERHEAHRTFISMVYAEKLTTKQGE
jgi:hypothetical protein|tara:strand:- start:759 stop:1076 length:318 start_codon:yes stop_codon:yes gene_type:complete